MTLLAGFTHPFRDAQYAFRRILKAMSEPGVIVSLPHSPCWGALSPAATAVLLTLVDRETPLWLDPALQDETLLTNLRFHTGALVTERAQADFALLLSVPQVSLAGFPAGDALAPEKSTSIIVEVPSLGGGLPLALSGPGMAEPRGVAPQLPESVLHYLRERPHPFPLGFDFIFTSGESLMALPRTTHVEVS
ncbi:phosphonate C-P lyase system protein PhnH [Pectobacteriaceae bacterium CE90]|nr:phosphonate C-P lyase system protein PhnH [Pectobacteriaceae bacterium CE90]